MAFKTLVLGLAMGAGTCADVAAQQLIGYVAVKDADVVGAAEVMDGRAVLVGSASVTAKDHTAQILLGRRGTVAVCQTSVLRLTESKMAPTAAPLLASAPLLLALDRGAIEIQMAAAANDAVLTPDLRFAVAGEGVLDLRLHVARNGDTCVESRGAGAPTLRITDAFGEATYELHAGQHVLFEHGSLREVVDHEREPCGCPELGVSLAEALLAPGAAATAHPFPAAVSEGLAPAPEVSPPILVPQGSPGEAGAQVTDRLSYSAETENATMGAPANIAPTQTADAPKRDVVHVVGRFFRRLLRR